MVSELRLALLGSAGERREKSYAQLFEWYKHAVGALSFRRLRLRSLPAVEMTKGAVLFLLLNFAVLFSCYI